MTKKGFTLVELMIVIVIIGILSAIAIPKFQRTKFEAEKTSCRSNMHNLAIAQNIYLNENGRYARNINQIEQIMPGASQFKCPTENRLSWLEDIDPFVSTAYAAPGRREYFIYGWQDQYYYVLCRRNWRYHGYVINGIFSWQ